MPNFDGTGPRASVMGRGMGPCGGGMGRGFGRGYRWMPQTETKDALQEELKRLDARKAYAEQRLKELG